MTEDPVGFIKDLDKYWNTDITKHMPEWHMVFDNLHWKNKDQLVAMNEVAKSYVG